MDKNILEHVILTIIAIIIGHFCGNTIAGYTFALGGFILRELAQAEYKWINNKTLNPSGLRKDMPWWGMFDHRVWDLHSILDFAVPAAVGLVIVIVSIRYLEPLIK